MVYVLLLLFRLGAKTEIKRSSISLLSGFAAELPLPSGRMAAQGPALTSGCSKLCARLCLA